MLLFKYCFDFSWLVHLVRRKKIRRITIRTHSGISFSYCSSGIFVSGINSQMINLSKNHLLKFEEGKIGGEVIDSTVLHELTHYFDDQDKIDYPGEAGNAFEIYCYGRVINE